MGSYVGIDLHRRRSVIVVLNDDGERLSWSRIDNTPANLAAEIVAVGGDAEVAMEATWGWYWAADVITECGARLHLAHPLGIAGYANRRVKNDIRDATLLADLLRLGRLPEAWVAPPEVRQLREMVRYRAKLARLRSGLKTQVHQTLGKEGVIPQLDSIWGAGGGRWLDGLQLGDVYVDRIESLRDLIELYDREIRHCDARIHRRLKGHRGYEAVQALRGVGPVLAAVFVAEIGDVGRFDNPRRLCSWAGLTPRLRESDAHTHRGHITKQGSRLLRWAAVEAVSGAVRDPQIASIKARVGARRGHNIGHVAAARHLLTLVYYGLPRRRDPLPRHRRSVMSGTATKPLGNGMTHRPVWSAHLIGRVVVVTERLHAHPQMGRDEGMPRHPTHGLPALAESRTEARLTVTLTRSEITARPGQPGPPPTTSATCSTPTSARPHSGPSGPDQPPPNPSRRLTAPHSTGMPACVGLWRGEGSRSVVGLRQGRS